MTRTGCLLLILATLQAFPGFAARKTGESSRHYEQAAKELVANLATYHITRRAPDDVISRRAWTNILESCDADHIVFTAGDIAHFAKSELVLDDQLRAGRFDFARQVLQTHNARYADCVAFATNCLATAAFDFSREGEWLFDRAHEPWPESVAARERLWREWLYGEVLDEYLDCETGGVKKAAAAVAKRLVRGLEKSREIGEDEIRETFFQAIVSAFDAHSLYLNQEDFDSFSSEMNLTFCGIGAEWDAHDGCPKIKRISPGGPLRRDGRIQAGDVILAVAPRGIGKSRLVPLEGKSTHEISRLIKGEKGTPLTLQIRHPQGTVACYTIVRDIIQMEEAAASSAVIPVKTAGGLFRVGYLRLPSFYQAMDESGRSCADDVCRELLKLRQASVCGIVFDLRNNGGGSLEDAVKIIGYFVRQGPAVRMIGPTGDVTLPVSDCGTICEVPVLVLTSRMSASAGELVPATLQDLGRAVVAGDVQTFGKGSAQSVHPFGDRRVGATTITDSRFYRITGASTQLEGVKPDLLLPSPESVDNEDERSERALRHPLPGDRVPRTEFEPAWDLGRFVPELKAASEKRLKADAKWTAYRNLVARSCAYAARRTLPLSKAKRQRLRDDDARLFDDLDELNERLGDPKTRGVDLVLDEGLNILVDLVRLNNGRMLPKPKRPVAPPPGVLGDLDDD